MRCHSIQPLLNALADRELGGLLAWRVKRHISRCPACAAELQAIERITKDAQAWRTEPASTDLQQRIQTALTVGKEKPMNAVCLPNPLYRRALITPRRVAVALLAVIAICAVTFAPRPSRSYIAFADVLRVMSQVKTVSWIETQEFYNTSDSARSKHKNQAWVRMTPTAYGSIELEPAISWVGPGKPNERTHMVLKQDGEYGYNADCDFYWSHRKKVDINKLIQDSYMYSANIISIAPDKRVILGQWSRTEDTADGKPVLVFTRQGSYEHIRFDCRFTTDAKTLYILKYEMTQTQDGKPRFHMVRESYRYNQTPPDNVFQINIPKTYLRQPNGIDGWQYRRKPSPEEERTCRFLVNRAEEGWNNGNFDQFASMWDFTYKPSIPGSKIDSERFRNSVKAVFDANWRKHRSLQTPVIAMKYDRSLYETIRVPASHPPLVIVNSSTDEAVRNWHNKRRSFLLTYYLRKTNGTYRIVDWNGYEMN